jgi:hypothetical protein
VSLVAARISESEAVNRVSSGNGFRAIAGPRLWDLAGGPKYLPSAYP